MNEEIKAYVRWRADQRCEYCGIRQAYQPDLLLHIEHIQAKQHGGSDEVENLALACHFCIYRKGPNLAGLDPDTGVLTDFSIPGWISGEAIFGWKKLARSPG